MKIKENLGKIVGVAFFVISFAIWLYRVFITPAYGINMQTVTILDMELIVAVTITIVIEEITIYQNEYKIDTFGMPEKIPEEESIFRMVLAILCLGIPFGIRMFMRWGKYIIFLLYEYFGPKSDVSR